MAISTLSRHVLLKRLFPRLPTSPSPSAASAPRVFIMGMPGAGMKGTLGDLNSERSYTPGIGKTHENTVAGNEALVHHYGAQGRLAFGLNPGLIATAIRAPIHEASAFKRGLGRVMEAVISLTAPSPEQYAANIVPLLVAPELGAHPGAFFGQGGTAILPTPAFKEDPKYVGAWIAELDALEARAMGGRG